MEFLNLKKKILIWVLGVIVLSLCGFLSMANAKLNPEQAQELAKIQKAIKDNGARWTAGETSVSRMSRQERKNLCGLKFTKAPELGTINDGYSPTSVESTPVTLDWRNYNYNNYITDVKDQLYCGSCYAFAAIAGMESQVLINDVTILIDLSEQFVVSCDIYNYGCEGGYLDRVFNFLTDTGTTDEDCAPYDNYPPPPEGPLSPPTCDVYNMCTDFQRTSGWSWVAKPLHVRFGVDNIKNALLNGPVVCGMNVYTDFFSYTEGVYTYKGGVYEGGHAVLIVGYGDGYWICKNSWGTDWGENGFFKIAWGNCYIGRDAITCSYDMPVIACYENADCDNADPCSTGMCINHGTLDSYCDYTPITPCCGNGECETVEDAVSCPADCNASCIASGDPCSDSISCCSGKCHPRKGYCL